MRRFPFSISFLCILVQGVCADQLAYLEKEIAISAETLLRQREMIVTFCSECGEDCVTLWHIDHAEARFTGHDTWYQVYVTAWPLIRSVRPVAGDELPSQIAYEYVTPKTLVPETFPIDLAYVYIWEETRWACLGKSLNLSCEIRVEAFRL